MEKYVQFLLTSARWGAFASGGVQLGKLELSIYAERSYIEPLLRQGIQ